jgi:hypothetical protein
LPQVDAVSRAGKLKLGNAGIGLVEGALQISDLEPEPHHITLIGPCQHRFLSFMR